MRISLRTRLVAAFTGVALVVLVLSGLATFGLVRRSLQQRALSDMRSRSADLAAAVKSTDFTSRPAQKFRIGLRAADMQAVLISPAGDVVDYPNYQLPPSLRASDIQPSALLANQEVSGRRGETVFLAIPTSTHVGRRLLVVIATERVDMTVLRNALPLMLAAGVIVLIGVGLLSVWLARRLTRPIRTIEHAAAQLATGDLTARAELPPHTDEELAALAHALNTMAAQLDQARGSERAFLLSISHDLRTPLTSIRGYAEALADGTLDDADPNDRKRAATIIGAEGRRLERLVRDLLDLSQLDSRQFSFHPRPCDVTELVRDAAEAFAPQARELGIALNITSGGALPVDVDPERLGQIVANLIENALKYATARVDVYAAAQGDDRVAVVVVDDGPGIPADQMARVFERLYTVRETPGRAVGTGLGLAIVRELASAMGGSARAEVAPGGGTRFVVSLPLRATASLT
ncbi:MAG: two-component system, OmpR family, sensor kinase [Actinomycetota bacterium]|nr:two-component system, OmpR family, sensor kinase [Actinomycetota bacterium]